MEFDVLLNKLIELTEKNLQAQSDFVKAIYELKSKIESESSSKEDIKHDLSSLTKDINDISSLMNQTSNKEIMALLQTVKSDKAGIQIALTYITDTVKHLDGCYEGFEDNVKDQRAVIDDMHEKVKSSNRLYKAVVAVLAILTLTVGAIQLINKIADTDRNDKIDSLIKEVQKKIK